MSIESARWAAAYSPNASRAMLVALGLVALMLLSGLAILGVAASGVAAPSHAPMAARIASAAPAAELRRSTSAGPRPAVVIPGSGNSTPVAEAGSVIATLGAAGGSNPYGVGVDPVTGLVYVTNSASSNVTVFNGTHVLVASIGVGKTPMGATFDPKNGYMYISNEASNNLTVINGTKIVKWIGDASFKNPYQGCFSPATGELYIMNVGGDVVTALNGLYVKTAITVGTYPFACAYDPANQDVYVTNSATVAQGGGSVTLLSPSDSVVVTLKSGTSTNFTNPSGIAYDGANGLVYVSNKDVATPSASFETLISNQTVTGKFRAGHDVYGTVYDPANGFIYLASSDNDYFTFNPPVDNVTVLNGTTPVTNITVGVDAFMIAYDPVDHCLYVAASGNFFTGAGRGTSVLFALLGEGPITAAPLGNPIGSRDVGQNVTFNSTLFAPGVQPDTIHLVVQPTAGFRCTYPLAREFGLNEQAINTTCTPNLAGNYTVWINVTDGSSKSVSAWMPWIIYPDPSADMPTANLSGRGIVDNIDAGQFVNISGTINPGSGVVGPYLWTGLPTGTCPSNVDQLLNFTCRFGSANNLTITVAFNDSNGLGCVSPPLKLRIYAHLIAEAPVAKPASADVNQTTNFSIHVTGGTGAYSSIVWTGLGNGTCTGLTTETATCSFAHTGPNVVAVSVVDTNGVSYTSPTLVFTVDPTLHAGQPSANRSNVDAGQTVAFSASASGGSGRYTYAWSGLPDTCSGTTSATAVCTMGLAGTYGARVTAIDTNGVSVGPSAPVNVTVDSDPSVGTVIVAPRSVAVGEPVTLAVAVAGGGPGTGQYTWNDLPPGCSAVDAAIFTCEPTKAGTYFVSVNVIDSNGFPAYGNQTNLTVTEGTSSTSGSASSSTTTYALGAVAAVAVVAAAVEAVLLLRRKK
jgi:DNA-binding beta-propeller fold protein YncE